MRYLGLSDEAWATIEPLLPKNGPGPKRADDRRIISGIIHMIKNGEHWKDCPSEYGPPTAVYNRLNQWSCKGHWRKVFEALAAHQWITTTVAMDASYVKPHRFAYGRKATGFTHL